MHPKHHPWKKYLVVALVLVAVLAAGALAFRGSGPSSDRGTASVLRKTITEEVEVSGTVKPVEDVKLGFEKTGRVRQVLARVGERVFAGQTLIVLENAAEAAAVEDARAKRAAKQAAYDDLKAGATREEIRVKESGVDKARADVDTEYADVPNVILDAYNKADNAVHRQADALFSNAYSTTPKLSFTSSDQQAVYDAENGRYTIETTLTNFKKLAETTFSSNQSREEGLARAKSHLAAVNSFLITLNRALNAAINLSDSTLATHKDALNTARTNVSTALSAATDAHQAIATGKINVETAESELAQTRAGATAEALAVAEADVRSAEANVKNTEALLAKTYLVSPLSGIVTQQDAKTGEIAGANTMLVALASDTFNVETFVPEVDIGKLAVGNRAVFTLDAYGSDTRFTAQVSEIDPAETVIDGVSTYKTTCSIDAPDPRIRSGLTANLTVTTATRERALVVPNRAIFERDGKRMVRVLREGGAEEERAVRTGIKSSAGETEIVEGLIEGERVMTGSKTK